MSLPTDYRYTQDRELSWLKFNERVLAEARDESVPLMERLKFAAIFTSNLDEFFMVRVGSITDMALVKEEHIDNKSGRTPQQQLEAIFKAVPPLYKQRDKVFDQLDLRLRSCNICRLSMEQLDSKARKQADSWFQSQVRPILSPLAVKVHQKAGHHVAGISGNAETVGFLRHRHGGNGRRVLQNQPRVLQHCFSVDGGLHSRPAPF